LGHTLGYVGLLDGRYPNMPRLTALGVRQAKPRNKPYKLFDERGLFLLISPSSSKIWRFKYRYCGKEKQISFGHYPDVSLAQAREARADARRELATGVNPSEARKARRRSESGEKSTFEMVGVDLHRNLTQNGYFLRRILTHLRLTRPLKAKAFALLNAGYFQVAIGGSIQHANQHTWSVSRSSP